MPSLSNILKEMNDNVNVQFLRDCITNVETEKNESEVTFVTQEINADDVMRGKGKAALVVWFDREEYNKAIQQCIKNQE